MPPESKTELSDGQEPIADTDSASEETRRDGGVRIARWSVSRSTLIPTLATVPVETPEDFRRHKEIQATRYYLGIVVALAVSTAVAFPFLEATWHAKAALLVGYAFGLLAAARTWWKIRDPEHYTELDSAVFAVGMVIGGTCGIYYFGFLSPAPIVVALGIFYFSLACTFRVALAVYLSAAILHGGAMVLLVAGVIPDYSVVRLHDIGIGNLIIIEAMVELVMFLTFWIGRGTAHALATAVEELHEKTRAVAQRDALLQEARRELDQALKVGGPGRFTEQRLGSYLLGVLVGRGAMSDVYEAFHVETGEPAAVKLLHRDVLSNPQHVRRFLREVRIAADLDLPNVVRVLEVGGDEAPVPFLAMELLHGEDMATLLRRRRRLDRSAVLDMLRQVARGVDAAHDAGVVHRDLKPQNLFRHQHSDGEHEWKILDFGVSRLLDGSSSLTAGHAVGTPSYMSPEQAKGKDVDQRADIFSLSVLAYRGLTSRPAFTGREVPQILHEVVFGMPPRPSDVADLPRTVDHVLAVGLAKRPSERFDTAKELVEALEDAIVGVADPNLEDRAARILKKVPWGLRASDRR